MRRVKIGTATVSGLCLGANPFSGFSHQDDKTSREMLAYHTPERIKQTLREAEAAGINTLFARTDKHIHGIIREYWDQGGRLQWFAQICQEQNDPDSWRTWLKAAIALGATGAYIHGGIVDFWYANRQFEIFTEALDLMRGANLVAGFAGHSADAHQWIRDHLDVDFQMCSHYNPTDRSRNPQHQAEGETWEDADRDRMLQVIAGIQKPVVHYKVFAGGNRPILPAFTLLGQVMRPQDVVLVGICTKHHPAMIAEDVALFETHVDKTR